MKLHKRFLPTNKAGNELEAFLLELEERYGLSIIETLDILNTVEAKYIKDALRIERHPNKPTKKADEE